MPWKIYKDGPSSKPYCVHRLNADGSKGDRVACHETAEKAGRQLALLERLKKQGKIK